MDSSLFLADRVTGQEPESAGKPDALHTLRAERTGFRSREAYGVRGFTPAFRARFMGSSDNAGLRRVWRTKPRQVPFAAVVAQDGLSVP